MAEPTRRTKRQEIRASTICGEIGLFVSRGSRPYTKPREIRANRKRPDFSACFFGTGWRIGHFLHEFAPSERRSAQPGAPRVKNHKFLGRGWGLTS